MGAVTTRSYSNRRDGACFDETVLTSTHVQANGIRVLGQLQLDDPRGTEGQVLYVPGLTMRDGLKHNVAFVADMSNNVYAFDVQSFKLLWKQHVGNPVTVTKQIDVWGINPYWGILSTPVIDPGTETIYVVALSSPDGTIGNAAYFFHALSLIDGSEAGVPLALNGASYEGFTLGSVPRKQRPGLLLSNDSKTVFVAFGSFFESAASNQGWVLAIDVTGSPLIAASWTTGTKHPAAGIWMGGQGLAQDDEGFIYGMTGNGGFEPPTDFGECFFKLQYTPKSVGIVTAASLTCVEWWSPYSDTGRDGDDPTLPSLSAVQHPEPTNSLNHAPMRASNANAVEDEDLGSGGALLIPSSLTGFPWSGVFGAGKDGIGYMVNMDSMGQTVNADFAAGKTDANFDKLIFSQPYNFTSWLGGLDARKNPMTIPGTYQGKTHHQHSTPVLYQSPDHGWMLFTQGENSPVRAFQLNAGGLTYLACGTEIASEGVPAPGGMPGGMIVLSCSGQGTNTGILWALMPLNGDANKAIVQGRLVLYAANWIDETTGNLIKIWDSSDWNIVFAHNKFNIATIADGNAFVPTYDGRVLILG